MTTVKSYLVILSAVVCLCVLLLLGACSENGDALSNLEQLDGGQNESTIRVYQLVLPAHSGSVLAQSADKLAAAITAKTGVRCDTYYDNESVPYVEDAICVLLGDTAYADSVQYIHALRRDDYICRTTEKNIILGGKSDNATAAAIEYLIEEILPYRDSAVIMDARDGFEYYAEYELDSLALCGVRFGNYDIVCDCERDSLQAKMAEELRRIIADRCGEYPRLYFGGAVTDGVRELVIKLDTTVGNNAIITYDGEDVVLSAKDTYGLSVGMERLYTEMFSGVSDRRASLDIQSEKRYSYVPCSIRFNSLVSDVEHSASALDGALALARAAGNSDVVSFGILPAEAWDIVKNNLAQTYSTFALDAGSGNVAAFAYDNSKLRLDEQNSTVMRQSDCLLAQLSLDMSGENVRICTLIGNTTQISEQQLSKLKQNILSNSPLSAAVLVLEGDTPYDVIDQGIGTAYNGVLNVSSADYRVCMLTRTQNVEVSDVLTSKGSCFAGVSAMICGTVCDAFASLCD